MDLYTFNIQLKTVNITLASYIKFLIQSVVNLSRHTAGEETTEIKIPLPLIEVIL